MTVEELREILKGRDITCTEKRINFGTQLRCKGGEIFTIYDTGKVVIGGKRTAVSELVQGVANDEAPGVEDLRGNQEIFIVYGHDTEVRNDLELMLRRMGFNPIILANMPAAGDTIIEKLESYIGKHGKAAYACVLLTPDDEGHKKGEPDKKKYRARQNVVLELGMVLARLGRKRVAILRKSTVEQPSDIDGLIYIPFEEQVQEIQMRLFQELEAAGFRPKFC